MILLTLSEKDVDLERITDKGDIFIPVGELHVLVKTKSVRAIRNLTRRNFRANLGYFVSTIFDSKVNEWKDKTNCRVMKAICKTLGYTKHSSTKQ